jgi:hypothetical protein
MPAYSGQKLFERIIARQKDYERRRELYDKQADVICELFRYDLVKGQAGQKNEGAFEHAQIIEGTAPYAAQVWNRAFTAGTVSRKDEWFHQKLKEPPRWTGVRFKGNDQVNEYLQDIDDVISDMYARSNFYDIIGQYYLDGGTVGSPVMLREYDPIEDRVICKVPDYASRYLDKDIFGRDNCLHVKWRWNALQSAEFFGKDRLPLNVKKQLENGEHYNETEYIQCIYGAGDPILDELPGGDKIPQTHPWLEYFICPSALPAEQHTIKPKNKGPGYWTRPFSSWHYHRNWHEVYGRSMAWFAVWDVRGANAFWEALFGEAELSVAPPTWAMQTLRGLLDFAPRGQNWARDVQEYQNPPVFLDRKTRWSPAIEFADRLKSAVERHFHNQLIMMVNQIMFQRNQPETAYGLMKADAERIDQLLPQIETAENQVLRDNHDSFMEIARQKEPAYPWGALPEPPAIVQDFSDGEVDVEFIGNLSRAQNYTRTVTNFYKNIGISELVFNVQPETINKIRWPEALERVLEAGNFPQADLVPDEEYEAIVQASRQRAMQQQMAENAPKLAQAVKNMQGKTEKDSPMAMMQQGAA